MNYKLLKKTLPTVYERYPIFQKYSVGNIYKLQRKPIDALHYHPYLELGLCVSGEGETYIENRVYSVKKGDVQIIPPMVSHLSKSSENSDCCWYFAYVDVNATLGNSNSFEWQEILSAFNNDAICGAFTPDEYPELTQGIVDFCREGRSDFCNKDLSVSLALWKIVIQSERIKANTDVYFLGKNSEIGYQNFNVVTQYVSKNLGDNDALEVGNLAKIISVSESTLRRLFIDKTGYSPKEYVVRARMASAENLLRKTDFSVSEIAEKLGYNEPSIFYRTFKKYFNLTPLAYRKNLSK